MCILTTGQFRLKKYSRDLANWADAESEIETVTISVLHFGTREQTKITSMFVRDNESDDRAHFSTSAVSKIETCRKLLRPRALIRISWIIMITLDHKQWTDSSGEACSASGNFSFVIGMSLRVASISCQSKANPCFYTFQYEGTRGGEGGGVGPALGNGETATAWFTKVGLRESIVPFAVWSPKRRVIFFLVSSNDAKAFRKCRCSGSLETNERTEGGGAGLFRSNNSRREQQPEMWLIGGRELVRPSESRGYLSIDPRPREASTAFRVIRGRWEQIRVLAFLRFRVRLAAVVAEAPNSMQCWRESTIRFR